MANFDEFKELAQEQQGKGGLLIPREFSVADIEAWFGAGRPVVIVEADCSLTYKKLDGVEDANTAPR